MINENVLDELQKQKSSWLQKHGREFHNNADSKCAGEIIQIFDSVDGQLMCECCSECGELRDV